jgi:hypothetical protein
VQEHHFRFNKESLMGNRNRIFTGLLDAAYALDEQAAGRDPELSRVLSGRRALDADLHDAALCLERVVTKGTWHLDVGGRARAAKLASMTRVFANRYAEKAAREE